MTTIHFLDCSDCLQGEKSCDCVLASVLDRDRGGPVALDEGELHALQEFARAGLVPPLPAVCHLRAAS